MSLGLVTFCAGMAIVALAVGQSPAEIRPRDQWGLILLGIGLMWIGIWMK